MKKLIIFDLDGTLLNTIDDLGQAANYALNKNGFPTHSLASYPFYVGNGVRKLISRVIPDDHNNEETISLLLKDFMAYYDEHNTIFTKPYNGIPELLQQIRENGISLAVASNKYQSATEKLISHYFGDIEFVSVEGQKEGRNVKPDPSIVFSILGKAFVPKSNVLYVGDSGVDIETARRACIESVGVTWGFRSVKELTERYADYIVNSPTEIFEIATKE